MAVALHDGTTISNLAKIDSSGNQYVVSTLLDSGGTNKVSINASGQLSVKDAADGTTSATAPTTAIEVGGIAATSNPTAVANGQLVGLMTDKVGRLVVASGQPRVLVQTQTTAVASSASETTIVTAGAAGVFNDIVGFQITNQTATACTITIKDSTAGTTRKVYDLAASGGIVVPFNPPLPQSGAAANWTGTCSSAAVTIHYNVDYIQNI
jgi:hypothetical protein